MNNRYNLKFAVLSLLVVLAINSFTASPSVGQWAKKAAIPGPGRDAACEFSIGSKLYFGGGFILSTAFEEYDPATNQWTPKASIPTTKRYRAWAVSFSIGSKGYVATGQSDTIDGGQPTVTNDLWEYDPSTDKWTRKANLPGPSRDGAMVFVVNGKAYVGAGVDSAYHYLGDLWEYDLTLDKWTPKASLPNGPVGFPMAFSIGSKGYMVGGGSPTELTDAFSYDPSTDSWDVIAPFPGIAREAGVGFSIDTLGYVGLGEANYSKTYSDFYSYNPTTDTWSASLQGFPYKLGYGWPSAAVIGHAVFIGGGADQNFAYSTSLWSYSTVPTAKGVLTIAHSSLDFGSVTVGMDSILSLGVKNTGQAPITINSLSITGANAAEFNTDAFSSTTLNAGDSITLHLTFQPVTAGQATAILNLNTSDNSPVIVILQGMAQAHASVQTGNSTPRVSLSMMPNPSHGIVTVHLNSNYLSDGVLEVFDVSGHSVLCQFIGMVSAGEHEFSLDASSLHNGDYFLQVTSNGESLRTRFTVEH